VSGFSNSDAQAYNVAGVSLRCEICKHTLFWHRNAQLHTAMATFFDFEWLGPNADCYVCARCGYIHWFLPVPDGAQRR
jgi:hypothetical protein